MTLSIASEDPTTPAALALIDGCDQALYAVYPPAKCAAPSPQVLANADTTFLVARQDGTAVGCVAVVAGPDRAVMNRLFATPETRGQGVGQALVAAAEQTAAAQGYDALHLKTGALLDAAVALYRRQGYVPCPPFGGGDPDLLYFTKAVTPSP